MPKKHLLLVHPPQHGLLEGFSSGLIALANFVSAQLDDVDVELVDLGLMRVADIHGAVSQRQYEEEELIVVGITTTTATYQAALAVARSIRQRLPHAVIVLGGHHASAQADVILKRHDYVDHVIRGEGEQALCALLRNVRDTRAVPGLVSRGALGPVSNPEASFLDQQQLDMLKPTFRGAGLRSSPGKFNHVTYVSARGCPLKCAFCAVANAEIRAKTVAAVVEDIRALVTEHGFTQIAIEDNFFAHSPRRTRDLCKALAQLQRDVSFSWDCQTRVESMANPEVIHLMQTAGCSAVYLGVEALCPSQLQFLGKTPTPNKYLATLTQKVIPSLLDSSIDAYINLQVGLPHDTDADRRDTLIRLSELGAMADARGQQITIFPQLHVVYPGTQHYSDALANNRFGDLGSSVFESFTEWEAHQEPVLTWLGERFAHGTGGIPLGLLFSDELSHGRFVVDPDAVLRVVTLLDGMDELSGISVFRYGDYVAPAPNILEDRS
jgi:radical SAM superfamily enzyme YgiQ (UPF0313 family)